MASPNLTGIGGSTFGLYNNLQRGGTVGDLSAAANAAKLASSSGLFSPGASAGLKGSAGGLSNALGVYSGLKQGGVAGDTSAAVNAAQLGSRLGAFGGASGAVGTAAGYAAAPLSVYNAVKGYQSGDTGGDALRGAEAGASIGSIVPGVGTVIGGLVGGAVGAISSAFGSGKVDPENKGFEAYTQAFNKATPQQKVQMAGSIQNPYLPLAGYFDLRSNQLKGQNPLYQKYGRLGEQKFTNDLIAQVKQGQAAGIKDPHTMWSKVVAPWINGMGTWQDANKDAITGLIHNMTGQIMQGTYQQNFKSIGGTAVWGQPQGVQPGALAAIPAAMRRPNPMVPQSMTRM